MLLALVVQILSFGCSFQKGLHGAASIQRLFRPCNPRHLPLPPAACRVPPLPTAPAPPCPATPLPQVPEYLKRDCLLFYYPDCEQLARRIVECSEGTVELAEINWK